MGATPTSKIKSAVLPKVSDKLPLPTSTLECHRIINAQRHEIGVLRGQVECLQRDLDRLRADQRRAQAQSESIPPTTSDTAPEPKAETEADSVSLRETLRSIWQETCSTGTHPPVDDNIDHRALHFLKRVLPRLR